MEFKSNYQIRISEVLIIVIILSTIILIRNYNNENLFQSLFYGNIFVLIFYFILKIPFVKTISINNNLINITTLFSSTEYKFDQIKFKLKTYPLKSTMENIVLFIKNKKFVIKKSDWKDYENLKKVLINNIK